MKLKQLGPYEILEQLGRGGMGAVYRARDVESGDEVAVKVLIGALALDPGFRERFDAEIETLKMLRHPNIVRLIGYGEQDDVLFYSMELVRGTSLDVELKRGRKFTWEEVLQIGIQAARGLKHAHDRGIIHRDIKPANLMLNEDGVLKISDFGIAKLFGSTGMTSAGGVIGTAEYMSPEQADGKLVSHRSDLYSLGAVLYCLLVGHPPFVSKSIAEVLHMQKFATPEPLRRFVPDLPEEIERIIFELMEKDPQQRIANATLLARRLQATLHGLKQQQWEEQQRRTQAAPAGDEPGATAAASAASPEQTAGFTIELPADDGPSAKTRSSGLTRSDEPESPPGDEETLVTQGPPASRIAEDVPPTRPDPESPRLQQETVAATHAAAPQAETEERPTQARFTVVREEELGKPLEPEESPWHISPQTWVLVAVLIAVGLTIWYLLQPPSADRLYEKIVAAANSKDESALLDMKQEIETFLGIYSNDPRAAEVEKYLEELQLLQMQRRLALQAKRLTRSRNHSPVQAAYVNAMRLAPQDPAEAREQLHALLALYEGAPEASSSDDRRCLELARRQLELLEQQARPFVEKHLETIRRRLAAAEKLAPKDPQQARRICQAIVQLYGRKSWAQEAVRQARALLERLPGPEKIAGGK